MSQDCRADQEAAAHVRAGHISVFLEIFQVLLVQRIDQLPPPQAAVPVKQRMRGVQHVVGGQLPAQLDAARRKLQPLLIAALDIHVSQSDPEEAKRPVPAGGDAVDERLFLSREIHGTRVGTLRDRESAQRPGREHLQVNIAQLAADAHRLFAGASPFGQRDRLDLTRVALTAIAIRAQREQPTAVARIWVFGEACRDVAVHLQRRRHDLEPAPAD